MGLRIWLPYVRAKSGADTFVKRLADALRRSGHDPLMQQFHHSYQYLPWLLRACSCPPDVDIVIANSWNAFAFSGKRVPLIAYVLHCVCRRGYPVWKSYAQSVFHDQLVCRFEHASLNHADALVAISESTRKEMIEDFGIDSIRTIPLWVDNSIFCPVNMTLRQSRERTRILIVGNMSRRKGGDLIVPFCEALGSGFAVKVVAGLRGKFPSISQDNARLVFTSGLSEAELVEAYCNSDIVVCLSRHEGFGYTALEGMACGKPVAAFDVSGLRDVIQHGETGWLCPREDVMSLAATCFSLREDMDLARRMGVAGRQRAVEVFSESRALTAYAELFNSLGLDG